VGRETSLGALLRNCAERWGGSRRFKPVLTHSQ
jgi:hypothetical protein